MKIITKKVESNLDKRLFIQLPYRLYKNTPNWIPPLLRSEKQLFSSKNPFWKENDWGFFLAIINNMVAGRIAVFVNREFENHHNNKTGFFGFLEGENGQILNKLIHVAEEWLKTRGYVRIIGPMNPDIHHELGILIDGFDSPATFMLPYNFKFYQRTLEERDYRKLKDFGTYYLDHEMMSKAQRMYDLSHKIKKRYNLVVRTGDLDNFKGELDIIRSIYNDSMREVFGFTKITTKEFYYIAKDLKRIIDPRLVVFVERKGEPVAFGFTVPDYNEVFRLINNGRLFPFGFLKILKYRNSIKGVRVVLAGVKRKYQMLGLGSIVFTETQLQIYKCGYTHGELGWVTEDNLMMKSAANIMGARKIRTYRLFEKAF